MTYLANLKSVEDKSDINKLKHVASSLKGLQSEADKLNTGKFETTPVDLSKLSGVVENEVVKKTEYNAKIEDIVDKIPTITS